MKYKIVEEYDGRLPVFNIVSEVNKDIVKSFDSIEEAIIFLKRLEDNSTPCGEEDPCC